MVSAKRKREADKGFRSIHGIHTIELNFSGTSLKRCNYSKELKERRGGHPDYLRTETPGNGVTYGIEEWL